MMLNCCPNFEKCYEHYLDKCQRSTESAFDCSDCNSYQCYFLGFQAGKNTVIKKVSEVIQDDN